MAIFGLSKGIDYAGVKKRGRQPRFLAIFGVLKKSDTSKWPFLAIFGHFPEISLIRRGSIFFGWRLYLAVRAIKCSCHFGQNFGTWVNSLNGSMKTRFWSKIAFFWLKNTLFLPFFDKFRWVNEITGLLKNGIWAPRGAFWPFLGPPEIRFLSNTGENGQNDQIFAENDDFRVI